MIMGLGQVQQKRPAVNTRTLSRGGSLPLVLYSTAFTKSFISLQQEIGIQRVGGGIFKLSSKILGATITLIKARQST